jgi:trans-aconitate methyltransferase
VIQPPNTSARSGAIGIAGGETPQFGGWADLYQRFRPRYPSAVFDMLAAIAGRRRGLCIELGAGSGQATHDLLDRFDRVIAVEPDQDMAARIPADPRLTVDIYNAESVIFASGSADAVVAATALHWMDQDRVADRAGAWLGAGGVYFAFAYGAAQYPEAPSALLNVLLRHSKAARAHMHDRLTSWRPYANAMRAAGKFVNVEEFELYAEHRWTPEECAGFLMSTSYGQAHARASGDATTHFAAFAEQISKACGGRSILVRFPVEGAYGRRAGEAVS